MPSKSATTFVSVAIIVCGFAAIFAVSALLEKNRPSPPAGFEDSDLLVQGANLKGFSFGFEGLIADWYWMQSLQYIGDKFLANSDKNISLDDMRELNPRLLYPYLDNATTLDPKFTSLYEYGANVLPAIDKEKAVLLTQKGIAANPENWRLYHYLGYIYWKMGDYQNAAASYERGAAINDAPSWMRLMSAKMKSDGGSRETSRAIYRQMAEQAQDAQTKESAELRLLQLQSLDEREAVNFALQNIKAKTNRCAFDWREVFPLLRTVKLPDGKDFAIDAANNLVDPSGAPYVLNKEKCEAELDRTKTKIPAN